MKIFDLFLSLFLIQALVSTSFAAPSVSSTKSLPELARVSQVQAMDKQRDRACEIQLREKIAPTLCYARKRLDFVELDRRCRTFAAVAARLPRIDESTSAACKAAVRNRARDLAYVGSADALR